jgi:hypothetical protein
VFGFSRRLTGLVLVVLGAWAGILPYVGPLFGFRIDQTAAWSWTTPHWELNLAPGALAVLGGLFLLLGRRASAVLGGWLAMIAGTWLVVGPLFASLWIHAAGQTQVASPTLAAAMRPLGYHYGTGLVIVMLSAWIIGRRVLVTRPVGEGYTSTSSRLGRRRRGVPEGAAVDGGTGMAGDTANDGETIVR